MGIWRLREVCHQQARCLPTDRKRLFFARKGSIMSNNQLSVFKFEESTSIRTITIDTIVWFVGKDICQVLGYTNPTKAMNDHCRGVTKRYPITDNLGRKQEVRILSEADVMRLICGSKLPAAQKFERWVFEEVLPAIRRTGRYAAPSALSDASARSLPPSVQPELPLSAPCFAPEAAFYGVPVMSTTTLAKQLGVTPGRIHSALQNDRAGLIDGIDLFRIKNGRELRAGGCGPAWGHMTRRINLLTESGSDKMRLYLRNGLPAPAPAVTAEPLPPVKGELPPPELNIPRRNRKEGPLTCRLRLSELITGDIALLRLLEELEKAGYEVRREVAEVRYMRHVLQQLDCWRKQFRAASDSVQAVFTKQECVCTVNGPAAAGKFRTLY